MVEPNSLFFRGLRGPLSPRNWNPWRELGRLQSDLQALAGGHWPSVGAAYPRVHITKDAEGVTLQALVPGFAPENVDVQVDGDVVTLLVRRPEPQELEGQTSARRELAYGEFRRALRMPFEIDAEAATAKLEHGVLELRLPKAPELKPKTINVNAG